MDRAKTEQVDQQQQTGMAVEDQVQAAVERHVAAACTGHAQELDNMRLQMQQSLDARAQVSLQLIPSASTFVASSAARLQP